MTDVNSLGTTISYFAPFIFMFGNIYINMYVNAFREYVC